MAQGTLGAGTVYDSGLEPVALLNDADLQLTNDGLEPLYKPGRLASGLLGATGATGALGVTVVLDA